MNINKNKVIGGIMVLVAFLLSTFSTVRYYGADPRGTLLVAETILTHKTIQLDHYGEKILHDYAHFKLHDGHYYYEYPLGTPIASIPFVAVARGWGLDILQSEAAVQRLIVSFTTVVTMLLLFKLARLFLEPASALLISGVFWFGTSFASTTGNTLWSHNFAGIFSLAAIYFAVKATREGRTNYWPIISILLFSAYLCRPTLALLAPFVLLFLFTYNRLAAIKSAVLVAFFLGCFMVFSLDEFHQLLPSYYMQQQAFADGHFFEGLYGNLLSPSRGLLIYSPFILLAWLCVGWSWKKWNLKRSWLLIGLAWPVAHILLISSWVVWWGGDCFGPRLLMDILPGLFLLTIYTWPVAFGGIRSRFVIAILALSIVFSVYVNSYQGLFNRYTVEWNVPSPSRDSHTLFNWSFPQFLHSEERQVERLVQLCAMYCSPISPSEALSFASDKVRFINWSSAEHTRRWSSGMSSSIVFRLDQRREEFKGELSLTAGSLEEQGIGIFLNDAKIYGGQMDSGGDTVNISFSPALLQNGLNTIRFDLPDARQPGNGDPRVLALALMSFSLR